MTSRDVEVSVASGGHILRGTLTVPGGDRPLPAALLLPGSGPVDRDSNHSRMRLGITADLARALADAGVASLRYDKRGVGASTGSWRAAGLHDNVADATEVLAAVRSRPEVDAAQVFLVGHSEGALLAAAVAAGDDELAGVVLLSAAATRGEQLLLWQAGQIAPSLPRPVRALLRLLRVDLQTKVAKNHAKIKATATDEARIGLVKVNARWSREFLAHDPRPDLARICAPVLALTGTKDLQVDPADLDTIQALVPAPVETRAMPDVTHVLRAQPGPPSLSRYKQEVTSPVDPHVLHAVTEWVVRHTHPPRQGSSSTPDHDATQGP